MKIGVIVNLQSKGEHPFCGDKINEETGFSYNPSVFTYHGFQYLNFPWNEKAKINDYKYLIEVIKEVGNFIKYQSYNV